MTLPDRYFHRFDDRDDALFYTSPRKVVHIDAHAIGALEQVYARYLPQQGHILDLMSSWRSHLPAESDPAYVVGLGMNHAEMADNPQLDANHVHNLNTTPQLPFDEGTFDGVVCAVSVQYLTQPVAIFEEVYRTLKPGGSLIVAFSNRCFPQKAVAIWLSTDDASHVDLVTTYFKASGQWESIESEAFTSQGGDPLYAVIGHKAQN